MTPILGLLIALQFHAHAGVVERIAGCLAQNLKDLVVERAFINFKNQEVILSTESERGPGVLSVQLGRRLGSGWFGAAYRVENPSALGLPADERVVLKFPHAFRWSDLLSPRSAPSSRHAIQREVASYDELLGQVSRIQMSTRFPKNPSWQSGRLPIVPIIQRIPTEMGLLLVKPEVYGLTLTQIAERYGDQLTPEMLRSLREIYDLAQSIHDQVRIGPRGATAFSPDIRPPNLIWIEDPALLNSLGLNRPSFALFELDQVPFNVPHYIAPRTQFDDYLREFQGYLRGGTE